MAFRDDHDAALERIRALEQELADLERQLAEARDRGHAEASAREGELAEENAKLRKKLDAERRTKKAAKPAAIRPNPGKAASWHRVSQWFSWATGAIFFVNAGFSIVAMLTQADAALIGMLGSTVVGSVVGLAGLVAGGVASKHQAGMGWMNALGSVLFWAVFMAWPVISLVLVLFAVVPLWRGRSAMENETIGAVGRPIAMTMLFMALGVQLFYLTYAVTDL